MRPLSGLSVVARIENSGTFVRPTMIAPARRRFATIGESSGAIRFANAGMPFGVALPRWSAFSLIVTGTPCNAPSGSPRRIAASARSASCIASSLQSTVIALSRGFSARMRPSTLVSTSCSRSLCGGYLRRVRPRSVSRTLCPSRLPMNYMTASSNRRGAAPNPDASAQTLRVPVALRTACAIRRAIR